MKATRNHHIYLIRTNADTKHYPQYVYPFEWNNYEFFAARQYQDGVYQKVYDVTERLTGLGLGLAEVSPAAAIKAATVKLEKRGVADLQQSICAGILLIEKYVKSNFKCVK